MQQLNLRVPKGQDLTNLEIDENFRRLRAAVNSLETAVSSLSSAGSVLPGFINMYGGITQPVGYLWANGQAVSRVTYSTLFSIIGTTYGVGDGSSTFNVPDTRSSLPMGANPMGGLTRGGFATRLVGTNYGAESVNVSHSHTASGTISINQITVTPSGTVTINDFAGTVPVTINTATIPYTPAGTVSVVINNHTDTIQEAFPGHLHNVTLPGVPVSNNEATINAVPPGTYDTSETQVQIDLNLVHSISSQTFTGTPTNFDHTHTASNVDITHGHTGSFTGNNQNITPTGSTAITVNSSSPSVGIIPPVWICNYIIKY